MDTNMPQAHALEALVQPDRARTTLYTDPALFEQEMSKVFENTWVWVAHASEIAKPGDFKTTHVGLQPVIVVRDRRNAVHVHVNRCRHRAATVCEVAKGKTNSFVCPYHGWAYALDGSLRGVPFEAGYDGQLDKSQFPLRSLRVEQYNGLIFATFKQDMEPLEDFLGGAKKWIDLFMKQGAGFPVVTQGEHRFRFPGNWKIQLENTTDAYHFPLVHKSFLSAADRETEDSWDIMNKGGFVEDLGQRPQRHGDDARAGRPRRGPRRPDSREVRGACRRAAPGSPRGAGAPHRARGGRVRASTSTCFPTSAARPPSSACCSRSRSTRRKSGTWRSAWRAARLPPTAPGCASTSSSKARWASARPDDAEVWDRVQHGAQGGSDLWIMLNRGLGHEEALPERRKAQRCQRRDGNAGGLRPMEAADGGLRMDAITTTNPITLDEAMQFVWLEADLLDSASYDEWQALWTPTSRYVVPIEPGATDFENTLNYAYDDARMRAKRAERLTSGQSVSASPVARTVRLLSRFRLLRSDAGGCALRCAEMITEFRRGRERTYAADVEFLLVRTADGLRIERKVIRLVNSADALGGIGYIL